jgi:hypothetical protein
MSIATWKIMGRKAKQAGYHYLATYQRGYAPSVGEQVELVVDGHPAWWKVTAVFKDRSTMAGVENFTVRVDEPESASDARPNSVDDVA